MPVRLPATPHSPRRRGVHRHGLLATEPWQVVRPAGLRPAARQPLTAERLAPDDGPDHVSIDVDIADPRQCREFADPRVDPRLDPERQSVPQTVDPLDQFEWIAVPAADLQHRPEDLLPDRFDRVDLDQRRRDETPRSDGFSVEAAAAVAAAAAGGRARGAPHEATVAPAADDPRTDVSRRFDPAEQQPAVGEQRRDLPAHHVGRGPVDQRPDVDRRIRRVAEAQRSHCAADHRDHRLGDRLVQAE